MGASFVAQLDEIEALIAADPGLFRKVRGEVRRAVLHKFPYGVFYIIRPEFVSVIAIMHHARDPEHWQGRA